MVGWLQSSALVLYLLGAAEAEEQAPLPPELDAATRATLLMALLAIIALGIGMIAMVILGAHMVRRWSRLTPPNRIPPKPPVPAPLPEMLIEDEPLIPPPYGNDPPATRR